MMDWDIEELAFRAVGKTEQETEDAINNNEDVSEYLYEKYEVCFDDYCKIVKDLLPFTPQIQAGISGEPFHAFVDIEQQRAIVKQKSAVKLKE